MRVDRLPLGALETNCWIVGDDSGGPVVIIDPGDAAARIMSAVGERDVALVLLTHGHFDHLGAVREVLDATGAPFAVHELDAANVTSAIGTGGASMGFSATAPEPDKRLRDGDSIVAGMVRLRVLHTPGHTPGGICLLATDSRDGAQHLFSGDTLFRGSVGRTDFPGGDSRALAASIAHKLAALSDDTIVHPGHGGDTTIGREHRLNPFWPRG